MAFDQPFTRAASGNQKMVVILLRGAMDGLNAVVPYREREYYEARPSIAIPEPGQPNGLVNLDGQFGLHPALAALKPLWDARQLALIHASGSPDGTRSHFDAQDYLESGTPGFKSTNTGWMNRLLAQLPRGASTQAVNLGETTPRILAGPAPTSNVRAGKTGLPQMAIDREPIQAVFDQMYQGNSLLGRVYQEGRRSRELLQQGLNQEMMEASRGAPVPDYLATNTANLVKLLTGPTQTQLLVLSLGGWDTHVNQGNHGGQFARRLKPLGNGMAQMARSLGSTFNETVVVVMSEFGRTVSENGNGGTDHGHGNLMMVMGGGIKGGKVYGDWRGLAAEDLYQGRDLPVTTDFRDVLAPLLGAHFQLGDNALSQIFPNYRVARPVTLR